MKKSDIIRISEQAESLFIKLEKKIPDIYPTTKKYSPIFIFGAPRSGTTVCLQYLNKIGITTPTNLLSRFYKVPYTGLFISELIKTTGHFFEQNFTSNIGHTQHMLDVNEFYYFWRSFFKIKIENNINFSEKEIKEIFDDQKFYKILLNMSKISQSPIALKGMMFNFYIDYINQIFPNSLFIYVKRDLLSNAKSLLETRMEKYGKISTYYSFKNQDYATINKMNPYDQVLNQITNINRKIESSIDNISKDRVIVINNNKKISADLSKISSKIKALYNIKVKEIKNIKRNKTKKTNLTPSQIKNLENAYEDFKKK